MKMTNGTKFELALVVVVLVGMVIFWIAEHASSRTEIITTSLLILSALTIYGEVCEFIGKEKMLKEEELKQKDEGE